MIPHLTPSGVLPPHISTGGAASPQEMSPYFSSLMEIAQVFAATEERKSILSGLIKYREELRKFGFNSGFQWIDGSFLEDCESIRGRPPSDVDLVTFAFLPEGKTHEDFLVRKDLSNPDESKRVYSCDAYLVPLGDHPYHVVHGTRYWFGTFSHQRGTQLWKGMLQISLEEDDSKVIDYLAGEGENA